MNENQKKQEMPLVIVSGVVFEQIKPGLKKAKLVTLPLRESITLVRIFLLVYRDL